jgi:carboxymethylenebutenolidase
LPPIRGGAGDHGDLVLESADGTKVAAYYAHPDAPSSTGMVVLPDVRGLHRFYKDLTVRFAEAGMHAVAIDYFARTTENAERLEDFDYVPHVERMHLARTNEDIGAAIQWLRDLPGARVESVFTVGFCLGGGISWGQSSVDQGLAGCIGFYGQPARVVDRIPKMTTPLLVLAAGQDFTPVAEVEAFVQQANDAGVEAELHVYPDAPHSFFDRTFGEHQAACADAWQRILSFVERHS